MDGKIEKFLVQLPAQKLENTLVLREIFMHAHPGITESIKWNNLTFSCNKKDIAFIYTFKQMPYINLGFFRATELNDPKDLFEGTGNSMRHIKITTGKDIPRVQLKKWIKESISLYELDKVTPKKKR